MDASEAACLGHERDCVPRLLGSWCRFMSFHGKLVGGNSNIFYFHPRKLGKMNPF